MKKLFLYITLLLSFTSCEKYLEVKPSNILALKTYDDVKSLLGSHLKLYTTTSTGAHKLTGTNVPWRASDLYLFFGFYSDDLNTDTWLNGNWMANNKRALYTNSLNWQNTTMPGTIWGNYFSNIGFYNTIIDELANVSASQEEKDIVEQEARFLRAWYLFKVLQYFSPYHNNELGIPFNTDSQAVGSYNKQRKTQVQVYRFLIDELTTVIDCKTEPRPAYNIFYDKNLAHALLAEIYLFKGGSGAGEKEDYVQAITHAQAVMKNYPLQGIDEFIPFETYKTSEGGVYKNKDQALLSFLWYTGDSGMYGTMEAYGLLEFVRDELFELFDENDVRRSLYFNPENKAIRKFKDLPNSYGVLHFFPVSEMYLIEAESYARNGQEGEARQALEEFQRHRIRNYQGYKGADLLQEIMNERRREFCLEYDMRWCDLIRIQKGWSRNSYQNPEEAVYTLEDNDFRFCFPIPLLEEMQENNQIEQNPGWNML